MKGKIDYLFQSTLEKLFSKAYASLDKSGKLEEWKRQHPYLTFIENIYYSISRGIDNLFDIPMKIKCFYQRGKRGWSDRDWWGLDEYISNIVIECLTKLKKERIGLPTWSENKSEKQAKKEWTNILDTIINTFKINLDIIERDTIYIPIENFTWKKYKSYKRYVEKMKKKYNIKIRLMTKRESQKYEKGFDLFKKYFFNLWD